MEYPKDYFYTKDHEWAKKEQGNVVKVGITAHAQDSLGEIVYVELPAVGRELKAHETFGVVESIKAVSDLYSPVAGKIVETNPAVSNDPSMINREPHSDGWLVKIELSNPNALNELMDSSKYTALVAGDN